MQNDTFETLLVPSADPVAAAWLLKQLANDPASDAGLFVQKLCHYGSEIQSSDPAIVGGLLHLIHSLAIKAAASSQGESLRAFDSQSLRVLHQRLPQRTPNRYLLLHLLAMIGSQQSLSLLVESLIESPPSKWLEGAQAISPLMQNDHWQVDWFFPRALDCLQFRSLAAPLLDLTNYLTRTQRVAVHPASDHLTNLNHLLGEVSNRLAKFEEDPHFFGDDVQTVQSMLGEAVSLAVSLCDAVGLIGDESSLGKLNQAIELRHRRVQCEAAGALARLGEETGKKRLLELTADPAARLRAIHYADELGFGELVESGWRSEASTAAAEMALWLCQPTQMGVPPTAVEVIDSRRMLWPSFDDRVDVHLVRFEYSFGEKRYSNVGITGPTVFAMSADVADLKIDDIYAIYAGWHAEHPEIFTIPANQFNTVQQRLMAVYEKHLQQLGYEQIKAELLGFFLDEQAGVFSATRDATQCVVVTDGLETVDHPTAGRARPLAPGDLFNLFKGRKMLRTFNPTADNPTAEEA